MKFKVQHLKILSVLLLLGGLNFQQVFAKSVDFQKVSLPDKGMVTATAKITTSAGSCVKQLSVTGTSISSFTTYSGTKLITSQSHASGLANGSFSGSISASSGNITSQSVSYKQTTTAEGTWNSSGSSYWNYDYSATARAEASINSTLDLGVEIDNTAPSRCLLQSNKNGYVSSSGQVYVRPGTQISFSWDVTDVGCSGLTGGNNTIVGATTAKSYDGHYTHSQDVCDRLGNCTSGGKCKASYNVDGTAPTCTSINLSTTSWTNKPVTVSASGCSDSGSGFNSCTTKTVSSNGTASITCKDNVGNSVTYSKKVSNIDTVAPTCVNTTVARPSSGIYVRTSIPMSTGCSDGQSGCTASNYSGTAINGSGTITIADNAGNTTACSVSYNYSDTSAPTTTITFDNAHKNNSETEYTNDDFITVTVSATDNGNAGVNRVCYQLNGATIQAATCVNGNSTSFKISNEGITNIKAWSYDNAYDYSNGSFVYTTGNRSSDAVKSAYVDRTKPNLIDYIADDDGVVSLDEVLMEFTSVYDKIKETNPWINVPVLVSIEAFDTVYSDGSSSEVGSVEYY